MTPSPMTDISRDTALSMAAEGILFLDRSFQVIWANEAARTLLGSGVAIDGSGLDDLFEGASLQLGATHCVLIARARGVPMVANLSAAAMGGDNFPILFNDLRQNSAERLIAFATRDPVTGLMNRDAFAEAIRLRIHGGQAEFGVLALHLDRFSLLAEAYGRDIADDILRGLARLVERKLEPGWLFGHLFGATFAVLVPDVTCPKAMESHARDMHDWLKTPISVGLRQFLVGMSSGVAISPHVGPDADDILAAAEMAAYTARRDGGSRTRTFSLSMQDEVRNRVQLECDLRLALERNEFEIHFQPKIQWPSQVVIGFEALVRWRHPTMGMISPDRFIPLAERNGLIIPLGCWVMRQTCAVMAHWRADGLRLLPVSVNVSPVQLVEGDMAELLAPLAEFGVPRSLIEIEITESAMMDVIERTGGLVAALTSAGIRIAIDDFGTGHSSLGNLRTLPINVFKIDRSFVEDTGTCAQARDIVATIVAMARALSMEVVAEGVETPAQARFLEGEGVSVMQGYLFSRPTSAAEAAKWLERDEPDALPASCCA